ncbi:MAG: NAD/NADP octopine/nopaline dehydrogenase family protein [Bacteroidetes bacterium]|nr:NAD/NADP octopine/nopaline dehydrogenase family protein [Bacteroidota bacterium]
MRKTKYTIIGAGNGGLVTAGYISKKGFEANLYNRSEERIEYIKKHNYTIHFGYHFDKIRLNYVGTNLAKAVYQSDVIIIVITADGHDDIAEKIAPYLEDDQIVLLVPGRTLGALLFSKILRRVECKANVIIAEANTLFFAARLKTPGMVEIKGFKKEVSVSALYPPNTDYVIDVLSGIFTNIIKAETILETSFSNMGAIFHPVISLLNKERILNKDTFHFYTDGVTKFVAGYIEKVDLEFKAISSAIGIKTLSAVDWMHSRYGLQKTSIYTMIKSNPTYKDILAPTTINHRYIWEDIPTGLVPMSLIGNNLGVPTPTIDYFIEAGSKILGIDFRSTGRTLYKLGLSADNLILDLQDMAICKEDVTI